MQYLIIALIASIIGALSGIGGGVIIKPVLDLISNYDIATISLLSSFTVFAMATSSIIKHIYYKTEFKKPIAILLAIGGIIGGFLGDKILNILIIISGESSKIKQLQNVLLMILLILVLIYINKLKDHIKFEVNNKLIIVLIGISLGIISTFVGIGGGPINIVALTLFFSMGTKEAAVNSLILIFFSQLSKITNVVITQDLNIFNLNMLMYMIPAGIIGGLIGTKLNKKLNAKYILVTFNTVILFIIFINVINIIN